jgi:peptidoglycan/xylan/chitin deacetylase (PgdA/CDA1 family)
MKNLTRKIVLRSGLLRAAGRLKGRSAAILMYHSVMGDPQRQAAFLGQTVHSSQVFREQMELVARNYRPASLDEVKSFLYGKAELPARTVVVTFDDGYTDNYEVAAPVLNEVGIPATFYATVECVERRKLPWPARLRFALHTTNKGSWTDASSKTWPLGNILEREKALLVCCDQCCKLAGDAQEQYVTGIEEQMDKRVPVESGELMMNFDHMRTLVTQGHIVGSHTMTHPNMAYVSAEDARREMIESKNRLEHALGTAVVHFSYPCPALSPHWTELTVGASRDAGYETAVTTNGGVARRTDNPLCLKRIRPSRTAEGLRWNLECAFAGRSI